MTASGRRGLAPVQLPRRDGACRGLGTDVALQCQGELRVGDRAFAARMEARGARVLLVDSRVSPYLRLDACIHLVHVPPPSRRLLLTCAPPVPASPYRLPLDAP